MKERQETGGFTLLEILVALSIMLIILGISFATYAAATQSISRCNARMALEQEARTVLRRMAREIRSSYISPSLPASGRSSIRDSTLTGILEEEPASSFNGENDLRDEELFRLVTAGGIPKPDAIIPGLSVVAYRFDESSGTLFRLQARIVDSPEVFDDEDSWLVCARNVKAVALKYFDGEEWYEDWDSDHNGRLPLAVSIGITLETEDGPPVTFVTAARIVCQKGGVREIEIRGTSPGRSPLRIGDDNARRPRRRQE